MKLLHLIMAGLFLFSAPLLLSACKDEQTPGEAIEEAGEEVGDEIDDATTAE